MLLSLSLKWVQKVQVQISNHGCALNHFLMEAFNCSFSSTISLKKSQWTVATASRICLSAKCLLLPQFRQLFYRSILYFNYCAVYISTIVIFDIYALYRIASCAAAMQRFEAGTSSTSSRSQSSGPQSEDASDSESHDDSEYESESAESDEIDGPRKQIQLANLLVSQLTAFQDEAGEETQTDTQAAKNGSSSKRVKQVLKSPCKCAMRCTLKLTFRVAFAAVQLFWSMSKVAQDSMLWSLQQCQKKEKSKFLGNRKCEKPRASIFKTSVVS